MRVFVLWFRPNGEILTIKRQNLVMDCVMDLKDSPYNEQVCIVKIESVFLFIELCD